jgi:hypothetical protein
MAETPPETPPEPPDHHVYNWVMFDRDTLAFFVKAAHFYEQLLDQDIRLVQSDPELSTILDQDTLDSYPVGRELIHTRRVREWLEQRIEQAAGSKFPFVDISIAHNVVRFLKSVELLYLEHLRRKGDSIVSRATTSKRLLEALDQQLARFEEKAGQGIFRAATPYPLVIDQLPQDDPKTRSMEAPSPAATPPAPTMRPRAVVLESIEIRDPELRRRCLDLLAQFRQDGEHDRLDTVVSEATRILEARLRALAVADASCSGVDLAALAFRPPEPRLVVSEVLAEQEAPTCCIAASLASSEIALTIAYSASCSPSACFRSSAWSTT